jgi:hypothetical protein
MGMYLNQLPPTEVARLKAELAETLIANFCYPRFYDYRTNGLRMRPVDRAKRQEVWQYLNAVDFNVWGRVDVDSPDFQRQVERLFIHFVQRNRSFFGEQGRKRMTDVRTLITSCSTALAEGLRGHLRGQPENPPFGSPRPVSSWAGMRGAGPVDLPWEQVLSGTMQLQQQLQEVRGEISSAAPVPSTPPGQPRSEAARPASVPSRRPRSARPGPTPGGMRSNGSGSHEEAAITWPETRKGALKSGELRPSGAPNAAEGIRGNFSPYTSLPDASPTMPLPLGRPETSPANSALSGEISSTLQSRSRRSRSAEIPSATSAPPSGPLPRTLSQPPAFPSPTMPARPLPPAASPQGGAGLTVKQPEAVLAGDEDVVIFEQMRHQLIVWLRIEAVRAGIELSNQGTFQLVDILRQQEGVDAARLQIVSTLLNMCDQVITGGRATLFDYKQAMMFYLMHTRHSH